MKVRFLGMVSSVVIFSGAALLAGCHTESGSPQPMVNQSAPTAMESTSTRTTTVTRHHHVVKKHHHHHHVVKKSSSTSSTTTQDQSSPAPTAPDQTAPQ